MKKIALSLFSLLLASIGFSENLVLVNQTSYPNKASKMAVQWASSAKEVEEDNQAIAHGQKMNTNTMQDLKQSGKIDLNIPPGAQYFRLLVWKKEQEKPDYITNWVDIVPNKSYTINDDYLFSPVLMSGMGC